MCAQSQKDCENLLVEIVSERRVADEQRKQVEGDSERIGLSTVSRVQSRVYFDGRQPNGNSADGQICRQGGN